MKHMSSNLDVATGVVAGVVGTAAYTVTSAVLTPGGGRPVSGSATAHQPRSGTDIAVHWGYGAIQGIVAVALGRLLPRPAATIAHLAIAVGPWWLKQLVGSHSLPAHPGSDLVKHGVYVVVTAMSIKQFGHRGDSR